jgi:hypothetical protein
LAISTKHKIEEDKQKPGRKGNIMRRKNRKWS